MVFKTIISLFAAIAAIDAGYAPLAYSAGYAPFPYSYPFAYPYALPPAYPAVPAAYSAVPSAYSALPVKAVAPVAPLASAPVVRAVPAPAPFVRALPAAVASAPIVKAAVPAPFTAAVATPFAAAPVAAAKIDYADAYPQYQYAYNIQDSLTGDSKAQEESREGDVVKGRYSLIEADGSRRTVNYYADPLNGFNAIVQKELPVVAAAPVVKAAPAVVSV